MLTERVNTATRYLWRSVTACARNVLTLRARYRAMMDAREARGIALLREWLSPKQRAQFDAINVSTWSVVTPGGAIASTMVG